MEVGNTRVYTTTDNDGNTVEVHEETYFIEGGDAAARLSSALTDSAQTRQVTETLPDGSVVITTTITTVGDDGIETEEIITETIPPPADAKADDPGKLHHQLPAGRDPSAHLSSGGGTGGLSSKPIIAQYAEDEYSEYKPPKRYEKQQKDSAADKLAPKVTIMGLPKDHQQKTAEDLSEGAEHGAAWVHENGSLADACAGSHKEPQFERGAVENQPVARTDVARESDRNEEEELPEKGLARNLLSRFKNIESEAQKQKQYKPSGVAVKPTPTPLRPVVRELPATSPDGSENDAEPQHVYEAENQPVIRTDVVKESDTNSAEELPEIGLARSLLSKFKSIESSSQSNRDYKPSGVAARDSTDSAAVLTPRGGRESRTSVTSSEGGLSGHYEPAVEGGEFENQPQVRTDVARESDGHASEDLPEAGLARNLLSRFKNIESEARESQRVQYKPSGVASKATPSKIQIMAGRTSYGGDVGRPRYDAADAAATVAADDSMLKSESGEFESVPEVRTDVARESDSHKEELPNRGLASSLLSRFKSIEAEASTRKDYVPSGVGNKPTPTPLGVSKGHVHVASAEGASVAAGFSGVSEPAVEGGEFENQPAERPAEVACEAQRRDAEELPEQGLAQGLLSKFKNLEEGASTQKDYRPSGVGRKSLSGYGAGSKKPADDE